MCDPANLDSLECREALLKFSKDKRFKSFLLFPAMCNSNNLSPDCKEAMRFSSKEKRFTSFRHRPELFSNEVIMKGGYGMLNKIRRMVVDKSIDSELGVESQVTRRKEQQEREQEMKTKAADRINNLLKSRGIALGQQTSYPTHAAIEKSRSKPFKRHNTKAFFPPIMHLQQWPFWGTG